MGWVFILLGLTALIALHEFGHFVVAKAVGMRVEKFSLFFGPKLLRVSRGETEYSLGVIPLGGYVRISGMNPREVRKLDLRIVDRAFYQQSTWKRIAVIAAGPVMNLIVAFAILWGVAVFGPSQPQIYRYRAAAVGPDQPAKVIAGSGERATRGFHPLGTQATIGPLADAAGSSISEIWRELEGTVSVLPEILTSSKARGQLHSVVGISVAANERFHRSVPEAFRLLALVSLSLALFNLLPLLPLDGGHIAWAVAEKLRGKSISVKVMDQVSVVGFLLVAALAAIGFSNDVHVLSNGGFQAGGAERTYRYCDDGRTNESTPCMYGRAGYSASQNDTFVPPAIATLKPAPGTVVHLRSNVVATVAGQPITKAQFDSAYESVSSELKIAGGASAVAPEPPSFAKCVKAQSQLQAREADALRTREATSPGSVSRYATRTPVASTAALRRECGERYVGLARRAMLELIHRAWTTQEAKALGITVSTARVAREIAVRRRAFQNATAYREYLHSMGMTPAGLERREREQILSTELQVRRRVTIPVAHISEAEVAEYFKQHRQFFATGDGATKQLPTVRQQIRQTLEDQARQASLLASERAYLNHWKTSTSCRSGYVVSLCSDALSPPAGS